MSVSVVIPTYNGAKFLGRALESVFGQTRLPDEVVVVDDASEDETATVAERIGRTAPVTVRVVRQASNSGGPARPLNLGIDAARGECIAVLEQDDLMRPRRIERHLEAMAGVPACSAVIGRIAIRGNAEGDMRPIWPVAQFEGVADLEKQARSVVEVDSAVAFASLLERNFGGTNSNLGFRKQTWAVVGGFDEAVRTCTDLQYLLKSVQAGPLAVVRDVMVDYTWRANSLNRANQEVTSVELMMVRLEAAFARPEWAGRLLHELQSAAIGLASGALARGDVRTATRIWRTLERCGGLKAAREGITRRIRRVVGMQEPDVDR